MVGKVVVITGATSGIGLAAAEKLTSAGARLVLIARDKTRGEAALQRLRTLGPSGAHSIYYADLSKLADMKRVASEIAAAEPRVDVLINNAGAMFSSRQVTEDGLELTFATNHMAYFVVTLGLADRLRGTQGARVVNTSSEAHRRASWDLTPYVPHLDFADLQSARSYGGFPVYGRSKLCNILFTRELSRRFHGTGVTANSLHPGFAATRFGDQSGGAFAYFMRVAKLFALTPEKGAETLVYLASSNAVTTMSGLYFDRCRPKEPSQEAQNDEVARRLWEESTSLSGLALS